MNDLLTMDVFDRRCRLVKRGENHGQVAVRQRCNTPAREQLHCKKRKLCSLGELKHLDAVRMIHGCDRPELASKTFLGRSAQRGFHHLERNVLAGVEIHRPIDHCHAAFAELLEKLRPFVDDFAEHYFRRSLEVRQFDQPLSTMALPKPCTPCGVIIYGFRDRR